jgi:DNA-binding response OmpR family regulator
MLKASKSIGRVLIVDDEPDLREILVEEFESYGYAVTETGSGQAAKEILKREPIDLVVSDMRMPGMGGIDLLKWIRSLAKPPAVIFISGYTELSEREFIEMGASALFLKPFKLKEVLLSAEQILTRARGAA